MFKFMFKHLNRGISAPLAIGIIAILTIVIGGGIIVYQYYFMPPTEFPPMSFSNNCNEVIRQVNNLVEKANYCNTDSDCVVSTETTKFCGCWSLINKNADLSKIKEGNEKYAQLNCPVLSCAECMLLPTQGDIKCSNNKCVDGRTGNSTSTIDPKEKSCLVSGGKVETTTCYCPNVQDFPSMGEVGICSCNPVATNYSKEIKICDCGTKKYFNGYRCILDWRVLTTKEECIKEGGTWASGGFMPGERCYLEIKTIDSGKKCIKSTQCEDRCYIPEDYFIGRCNSYYEKNNCEKCREKGGQCIEKSIPGSIIYECDIELKTNDGGKLCKNNNDCEAGCKIAEKADWTSIYGICSEFIGTKPMYYIDSTGIIRISPTE